MLKTLRRVLVTNVAYVLLLLSFVTLGVFVYAPAVVSPLAGIFGVSMVVSMAASVVGFRMGANIWDQPLRREQIDRVSAELLRRAGRARAVAAGSLHRRDRTDKIDHWPRCLTAAVRVRQVALMVVSRPHHNDHAYILAKQAVRKTDC